MGVSILSVEQDERRLAAAACALLAFAAAIDFLGALFALVGVSRGISSALVYAVLFVFLLRAVPAVFRRLACADLLIFAALLVSLLVSWLFHSTGYYDSLFKSILSMLLTQCVGMYFIGRAARDWGCWWTALTRMAFAVVIMQGVTLIVDGGGIYTQGTYSQAFAYQTLPGAAVLVVSLFKHPRVVSLVFFIVSLLLMMASGSRGPIFAVGLLTIILFVFEKRLGVWRLFIAVALLLLLFFSEEVIQAIAVWVRPLFVECGLSTRILDVVLAGNFFSSTERPILLSNDLHLIAKSPLWGYGIGGDRIAIASAMGAPAEAVGYYAHNFFLECFLQFGLPIGLFLCIAVCLTIIYPFLKGDADMRAVIISLVGIGFLPLMVSGSYLGMPSFFLLLGLAIRASALLCKAGDSRL